MFNKKRDFGLTKKILHLKGVRRTKPFERDDGDDYSLISGLKDRTRFTAPRI